MDKHVVAEMLAAFKSDPVKEEDLSRGDPLRAAMAPMSALFTQGVGFLASPLFPNPAVRELMRMVWDLVGNRITPVAIGPEVQTLTMAVVGNPARPQALIFMPHNWLKMSREKPLLQLGALVFVGAQAVDFYNQRILSKADSQQARDRARAYEAEYLLTLGQGNVLDDYQRDVLVEFPEGLKTPKVGPLLYQHRPVSIPLDASQPSA